MYLGPRPAYLTSGKGTREVLVVNTATGPTPHLAWAGSDVENKTFCGRPAQHISRTWFGVSGCVRCLAAARASELAKITDVDGHLIDLAEL